MRFVTTLAACFLSVLWTELFAADWLFVKEPSTTLSTPVHSGSTLSFDGPKLEFEYLISRDKSADRKPGAILVRVVRKYDPSSNIDSDLRSKTNLTRNVFPTAEALGDDEVYRTLYEKYHRNQTGHPKLRNRFHTNVPPSTRTDAPNLKMTGFLFNDSYPGQTTHRAYLLYYEGVNPSGTRIPFYVGITDHFERIKITVIELDPPPGVGIVPRTVEILK